MAILTLGAAGAVGAAGPYAYAGHGGSPDWARWSYGPVRNDEVQQITLQLQTGSAAADPDMHFAFGLRGGAALRPCPVSDLPPFADGCPLGRGITFGHVPDGFGTGGTCTGVAIEHFSLGYAGDQAIVAGSCVPFRILPGQRYAFIVRATADNVSWWLLQLSWLPARDPQTGAAGLEPQWNSVARGGCLETAGRPCPELAEVDQDYGDVFVASGFLKAGSYWSVEDLRILSY
ncbi:MAG: hypothetical protein BGP24_16870 [Lysobacterales bacterium 69-70]|nr:MAG: hypothetical protein ABS97_11260 [Xanthomonadaceae bacterium SCN 69-320]ODV21994.1 MAG: hypothetical protein ABT27_03615 [Xanthomonadaceae bacterium SCN 69-25]OJZ02897.1 MAG: hypothetical protein BGP24_16870 [Xanthomonadales bacterium 69-70]